MHVRFLGHSSFLLEFNDSTVLIDPCVHCQSFGKYSRKIPSPIKMEDFPKVSLILITHEHEDHFDKKVIEYLANRDGTCVAAHDSVLSELNIPARCKRAVNSDQQFHLRGVHVKVEVAHHPQAFYPMAYVVTGDGVSVYHAGDSDLIEEFSPDFNAHVALLPIGGNITMDIVDAVKATKVLKPDVVIPMHYNTFDMCAASPEEFAKKIEKSNLKTKPVILSPNEKYEYKLPVLPNGTK